MSETNRMVVVSLLAGLFSGLAAVLLLKLIDLVKSGSDLLSRSLPEGLGSFVSPGIGMLLSLLIVTFLVKDDIGHGVTRVLVAVSRSESRIKPHNMWSSVLTSSLTIGMGGSVGAEAPIVYTGAAIGSNLGRLFGLSYRNLTTLLGCGAAGAIAGIFKAPLAGVLFTMEVLLFNNSMSSIGPLLISSVSATFVSYLFLGHSFPFHCAITPFSMGNVPFYLLLGVFGGLISVYFLRTTLALEDRIAKMRSKTMRWVISAIGVGLLVSLFPQLFGEGYGSIGVLLSGADPVEGGGGTLKALAHSKWGVPAFFLAVMLLKVFAMTLTNAGGGVGGTFGPTLFVGAIAGFVLSRTINIIAPLGASVPEQNFTLVGMAALMAGVMQAPMTAIFLIAEITDGYELFLPLIIASTVSFGTTRIFERYSIYSKRVAQAGQLLTHDSDHSALALMSVADLVRDKYPPVPKDATLREILPVIQESDAQVFPVLDSKGRLKGYLEMDSLRKYIFRTELYDSLNVHDLMEPPNTVAYIDEPMASVMQKFDKTGAWRIPVLGRDGRYKGFVSRSRVLSAYREELKLITED